MIDETIGSSIEDAGQQMRLVAVGERGQIVYGPYRLLPTGVYQVDFTLALADDDAGDDPICATIDVTTDWGNTKIEERDLRASSLSRLPKVFTLTFVLRDIVNIEHRIWVTGAASVLVGCNPVLRRVSGVIDVGAPDPFGSSVEQASAMANRVRAALRYLSPQRLNDKGMIRLGKMSDGGYLCVDDFAGIDTAFSFGINDDISWDCDAADRGLTIIQFDHTVDDPAPDDDRMIFNRKMIAAQSGPDRESLSNLIRIYDRQRHRPNIVLKMDIECGEWDVFGVTSEKEFARLAWIVCEIHCLQNLANANDC